MWILLKQETVSGSGISAGPICKSAPRSRQTTTPAPHHSVFYRLCDYGFGINPRSRLPPTELPPTDLRRDGSAGAAVERGQRHVPLVVDQVVSFSGDLVVLGHTQLGHQRDLFTVLAAAGHLLTTTPVQRRYTTSHTNKICGRESLFVTYGNTQNTTENYDIKLVAGYHQQLVS